MRAFVPVKWVTRKFHCFNQFVTESEQTTAAYMDFALWTTSQVDPVRGRRLTLGIFLGAAAVIGTLFFFAQKVSAVAQQKEEEILDVQLAEEPEPDPEPVEEIETPKPKRLADLKEPVEVPDDAPEESEPSNQAPEVDPYADRPVIEEKPAVVEVKPPPKPKVVVQKKQKPKRRKVMRVTENVTPPTKVSGGIPSYPAEARSQGIEGVVIVKYIVNEAGVVSNAKVVKGPSIFHAACLSAVRGWRFRPAMFEGNPVPVVRIARFPFKLRT